MALNYRDYKVEDFVLDQNFKNWVLRPDSNSNLFWEKWIEENQGKVADIRKARAILLSLSKVKYEPDLSTEDEVWGNISRLIDEKQPDSRVIPLGPNSILSKYPSRKKSILKPVLLGLAASVALMLCSVVLFHLIEKPSGIETSKQVQTIEKSNPRGQKSTVFLPDGSKVYLNSESKISYTEGYNNKDRVVWLEGEAFFEVAKDSLRPFTVITDNINTTALGTSFNVASYKERLPEVSLMTGSVRVVSNDQSAREEILFPGQLVFYSENKEMVKREFDIENKALWRNRIIYFHDTPFNEALHTLERWYDVSFNISGTGYQELLCTGKFENDYLSNVLNSLSYSLDFQYEIRGDQIFLTFKNPKKVPMKNP